MNSIEVFKTDVKGRQHAGYLIREMNELFPNYKITIDLQDNDKVLRVENRKGKIEASRVIKLLRKRNFHCRVLDY